MFMVRFIFFMTFAFRKIKLEENRNIINYKQNTE